MGWKNAICADVHDFFFTKHEKVSRKAYRNMWAKEQNLTSIKWMQLVNELKSMNLCHMIAKFITFRLKFL